MTARFISSIIALIVLLGCHSNGAYSYNQYIVAKEKQIGVHTDEAVRRFNIFSKSDNYDSLTILSQEVEEMIGKELQEIESKQIPVEAKGAEDLKRAAIRYFSYMKTAFIAYKELGQQTNNEAREAARVRLVKVIEKNTVEIQAIQEAQRKFGKENNLRMK